MLKLSQLQDYRTLDTQTEKFKTNGASWLTKQLWKWAIRLNRPGKIIYNDDGSPYLLRIYLSAHGSERKGMGRWLHYFFCGDEDRELHNHPQEGLFKWFNWNVSIILTGGYVEERLTKTGETRFKTFKPGNLNFIQRNTFHKVLLRSVGCWTLFFVGPHVDLPRGEDWGFLDPVTHEYIPWGSRKPLQKKAYKG